MGKFKGLWAAAIVGALAIAGPAAAAVVKANFGVSVTVVSACRIVPGQAQGCAPVARTANAVIPAPQPVVRYSRDPKTGTTVETIEF